MDYEINSNDSINSLKTCFEAYEKALVENDLAIMDDYFWESELTVRIGVAENLYGSEAIKAYRRTCVPVGPERRLYNTVITTFGNDFGTVSTEFNDGYSSNVGRQMQTWVRFGGQWKVVAAHVSLMHQWPD